MQLKAEYLFKGAIYDDPRRFSGVQHSILCEVWDDPIVKLGLSNEPQTYTSEDTEGDETSTGVEYDEVLNTDPDTVAESDDLGTKRRECTVREASDTDERVAEVDSIEPNHQDIPLIEVTLT